MSLVRSIKGSLFGILSELRSLLAATRLSLCFYAMKSARYMKRATRVSAHDRKFVVIPKTNI